MKAIVFFLSSYALISFGQNNSYKLPREWDKSFVISTSYVNNRSGSKNQVMYTYDSGIYKSTSSQPNLKRKVFALAQTDRDAILVKLRELKIESVKPDSSATVQRVEWSIKLCIGTTCIEGNSASALKKEDQTIFLAAYRFLNDFAIKK